MLVRAPRVLVISSTFPRWPDDSTPSFVRDLSLEAARAWDVTVLAPHHPGAALRELAGGIDVRRFRYFRPERAQRLCYGGGILPNARASVLARVQLPCLVGAELVATRRLVRGGSYDLVHAHFLVPQGLIAALCTNGPLVVSVHGSDLFALRGRAYDALVGRVIARASRVTVNSRATASELVRRVPSAADKVRILPMGVDTTLFRPSDDAEARASRPLIVFVGRLSRQKGAHVLVEAFRRLRRAARLVIVGAGPERAALEASAHEDVELRGPLPPPEVARLLREATLLVVPSLGTEAQGIVAIEAMVSGCPVIVSRSGGLAELVEGGRGIAVEPGDPVALAEAITRALDDEAGTRARAAAARAFAAEEYAWSRIGDRLLAIYAEATGADMVGA